MNWYRTAEDYCQIGHENYILWFSNDEGRITTSEPQKKKKNTNTGLYHSNWDEWQKDTSKKPYRGRYDTVRKIITIVGPGWKDAPNSLLNGLRRAFPDARSAYVFDGYSNYEPIRLASKIVTAGFRGEWWIIDGEAVFADADIGDMGHQDHVMDYVQRKYVDEKFDKGEYVDWEAFKRELATRTFAAEYGQKPTIQYYQKYKKQMEELCHKKLLEMGMTEEEYLIANGGGDARQYGMEELGWKRVKDSRIQTHTFTSDDLRSIARGLGSAYGDEGLDDNSLFYIEVGNGQTYQSVPYKDIEDASPTAIAQKYGLRYVPSLVPLEEYAKNNNWYRKAVRKVLLSPEIYDQLEKLANKTVKGPRNWTLEDLQLQSNYPEEYEWFLQKLYNVSKK